MKVIGVVGLPEGVVVLAATMDVAVLPSEISCSVVVDVVKAVLSQTVDSQRVILHERLWLPQKRRVERLQLSIIVLGLVEERWKVLVAVKVHMLVVDVFFCPHWVLMCGGDCVRGVNLNVVFVAQLGS